MEPRLVKMVVDEMHEVEAMVDMLQTRLARMRAILETATTPELPTFPKADFGLSGGLPGPLSAASPEPANAGVDWSDVDIEAQCLLLTGDPEVRKLVDRLTMLIADAKLGIYHEETTRQVGEALAGLLRGKPCLVAALQRVLRVLAPRGER